MTEFKNKIEQIKDNTTKVKAQNLLSKIIAEVNEIDRRHQEMTFGTKLSSSVVERRENLLSYRRQLSTLLKDYEAS